MIMKNTIYVLPKLLQMVFIIVLQWHVTHQWAQLSESRKLKNFFMHKDSLTVKQYERNEEEDTCAIMLISSVILSTIVSLFVCVYFISTQ
jgi:hypothetical protein